MRCVNGKGVGGSVSAKRAVRRRRENPGRLIGTRFRREARWRARARGARGMDRCEPSRHVRTTKRSASVFPSPLAFGGAPQQHHMILARASRLGRRTILRGSERRDGSRAANATLARPYPRARDRRTTPGATFARAFRRDAPSPVTPLRAEAPFASTRAAPTARAFGSDEGEVPIRRAVARFRARREKLKI